MSNSTKAALLSALVFPGAGHFFLKRYVTASILFVAAMTPLFVLITEALDRAFQIAEKIQSGAVSPDIGVITELITRQPSGPDAQIINIATLVLLISWLIGIADSYRVGYRQDRNRTAAP